MVNPLNAGCGKPLTERKLVLIYQMSLFFHVFHELINQYQACLNAFLMVIPNMITRFHNVDISDNLVLFLNCRLLTPEISHVLLNLIVM